MSRAPSLSMGSSAATSIPSVSRLGTISPLRVQPTVLGLSLAARAISRLLIPRRSLRAARSSSSQSGTSPVIVPPLDHLKAGAVAHFRGVLGWRFGVEPVFESVVRRVELIFGPRALGG